MYKRIGIVDDGTKNAFYALKLGLEFAKREGVSPTIMSVMDILSPMEPYLAIKDKKWEEEMPAFRKIFTSHRARTEKILSEAEKVSRQMGVVAATMFLEGQPGEQVLEQSKRFDILFVGAHSKKKENIAGRLAREGSCDVFVSRNEEVKEVLLALKGKPLDRDIIERGMLFAKGFGAHVTALHVSSSLSEDKNAPLIVKKAKEAGQSASLKVKALLARGSVLSKIQDHAKKSDLVVLGTRGMGGLSDIVLGSLAEKVVKQSPCSVLIVRPSARRRG